MQEGVLRERFSLKAEHDLTSPIIFYEVVYLKREKS